jgi:hypothetical protein
MCNGSTILLKCYLALRGLTHEWREYPVYRQHAEQQRMPYVWHLSREIQICEKADQRGRTQARVLTGDESQWFLLRVFERSSGIYAKVANGRLPNCARRT